ncbi:MAG TPA: hypothetical protein VHE30_10805 [Polyangiaceae bacterium]|nr:hypothetical protein [Polyangiaceae bacterium]
MDLKTDDASCGACGVPCDGNCEDGICKPKGSDLIVPVPADSGIWNTPPDIRQDSTHLYWIHGRDVLRASKSDGTIEPVATDQPMNDFSELTVVDDYAYWLNLPTSRYGGPDLVRARVDGAATEVVARDFGPYGIFRGYAYLEVGTHMVRVPVGGGPQEFGIDVANPGGDYVEVFGAVDHCAGVWGALNPSKVVSLSRLSWTPLACEDGWDWTQCSWENVPPLTLSQPFTKGSYPRISGALAECTGPFACNGHDVFCADNADLGIYGGIPGLLSWVDAQPAGPRERDFEFPCDALTADETSLFFVGGVLGRIDLCSRGIVRMRAFQTPVFSGSLLVDDSYVYWAAPDGIHRLRKGP